MRAVLAFTTAVTAGACLAGCDGLVVVIGTAPSSISGSTVTAVVHVNGGTIPFGTPVNGWLTTRGCDVQYRIVPPRTGNLVLGVSWNKAHGPLDVLFASNMLPRPIGAAPYSARLPVQAGQTYVVSVADGAPSDPGAISLPFTITTTME